jgi:Fe-S oxidoreductase
MPSLSPYKDAIDIVKDLGGEAFEHCYQCGLCSGTCPWNLVRSLIVRRLIHQAQLGLVAFEEEDIWLCATCGACVARCPRGVEIIDIMKALRRVVSEMGVARVPESLRITAGALTSEGNPIGEDRGKRGNWAAGLGVKEFAPGVDLLYSPCCIPALDPKARRIATATAKVLAAAGADFGILGARESCCGESIRKAGGEEVFQGLVAGNTRVFSEAGVKKILVSSPHCYHTFKNEYPEIGGRFEVIHFVQYVHERIREGALALSREINKTVAYHDPCYLGRHNGIYDEPREVLRSIPGLKLIELPDARENSLCCGGGGGRIWMETVKGERFSDLRLKQALDAGAEVLAISCPYCMLNFDDSALTMDVGGRIQIRDISELVWESVRQGEFSS